MANKLTRTEDAAELRQQAEEMARKEAAPLDELSPEDMRRALHELRVHQIELEMQNEELRRTQVELDASRARYFELYDLAPVGYLTLSQKGLILEVNLAGATMLGVDRSTLVKIPFSQFAFNDDLDIFYRHRRQVIDVGGTQACELRLMRKDGTVFWAHLSATAAQDVAGVPVVRVVLSDITERKQAEAEKEAERWRLASVLEGTNVGTWEWNVQTGEAVFTEKWAQIIGYRLDELDPVCILTWERKAHPDDVKRSAELLERHFAGELPYYECECRVLHKDGHWVWVLDRGRVASRTRDGKPLMMFGTRTDITERKRAEKALRESENRLAFLVQATPAVIYTAKASGDFGGTFVSANITSLTGYAPSEFVENPGFWASRTHPDDLPRVMAELGRLPERGEALTEYRFRYKDGSYHWMQDGCRLTRDAHGAPEVVVGFWLDITERKRAEEALRESDLLHGELFEAASDALLLLASETGQIVDANSMATALYGYERDDLLTRKNVELSAEPEETSRLTLEAQAKPGEIFNIPSRLHRKKDGTVFPVEISARSLIRKRQSLILVACRDITERKQAEADKARLAAQLQQARKMESVGRLAGGVAHTFNNKLMGIMNFVELCWDELPPEHPVRGYLDEIMIEAQDSATVARQLLAFARKQHIAPKVLDLNDALGGMLKLLRQLLGEDIDLDWRPDAALWPVKLDPAQIDQILANLCANARTAIVGVGKVAIETANVTLDDAYCAEHADAAPGEYVRLAVSDTGCGMDAQMVANLFEPFFTTQEMARGAGLGLATVYGIVKQNHGHIEVQSEIGKGTTFSICLPREASETDMGPDAMAPEKLPRGTETILLAEDEKSVRITSVLFLKQFGYTVMVAETPEEALRLGGTHAGPIHLLVTDVIMPGMNGPDLAGLLAAKHPKLKCLFMSGYTADVLKARGTLDEGMPFLSKPFSRHDLARKVREVLDGR